jgi:DNA-binding response OmpR family regulator
MKILIIEDQTRLANFLKKALREAGYDVDVASDGQEGYDRIGSQSYDLILLDLMLPKISGFDLIPQIRTSRPTVPIIAVTARASVEDRVQGLNLGCDDYLIKPFSLEELLARINAQLRRGGSVPPAELRAADLVLNPLKRNVTRGGKTIELSNKEYFLLEYLLRNKNRIVTRDMIVESVWECNFDNLTNVVDVYINYLRNKIDRDFEPPLIQTVRGKGYVLRDGS